MKFCWTTLTVKNMEESLKFYEEIIGLSVNHRFEAGPNMEIAFLGQGETKIELICNKDVREVNMGEHISLGFEVSNLDEMMALVKERGIAIHSGPFQPNPNTRFFFILDPNDLKIQLVESK